MDTNRIKPDSFKSCTNCKMKKVKCQGEIPCCDRCKERDLDCDVSDHVYFSYSTVMLLLKKAENLDCKLKEADLVENKQEVSTSIPTLGYIDELSHEVGTLTYAKNKKEHKYIGAATGSNFVKSFLNQMNFQPFNDLNTLHSIFSLKASDYQSLTNVCAPLPPHHVAKLAVSNYINYIHVYYPLFITNQLLDLLDVVYDQPETLSYHDKYLIFMVIAIGFERGKKNSLLVKDKLFNSEEFCNTAKQYLKKIIKTKSVMTIQELALMSLWEINTNIFKKNDGDLWYLGRYIMSLALEWNLEEDNTDLILSKSNKEWYNRLFWSVFLIERSNAVKFGREICLKQENIDTQLPKFLTDDEVLKNSSFEVFNKVQFKPCTLLTEIYDIYSNLLEIIYTFKSKTVAKNHINGKIEIQGCIGKVMFKLDKELPHDLICYHEMKIRINIASILLNRPSPQFLNPSVTSLLTCKENCIQSMNSFNFLIIENYKFGPGYLHDLLNVSLSMVYCCWKTDSDSNTLKRFSNDALNVMNEIVTSYPSFIKFKNLYLVVSSIIIRWIDNYDEKTRNSRDKNNKSIELPNLDDPFKDVPPLIHQLKVNMQKKANNINIQKMKNNDLLSCRQKKRSYKETGLDNNLPAPFAFSPSQDQSLLTLDKGVVKSNNVTSDPESCQTHGETINRHIYSNSYLQNTQPLVDLSTQELFQDVFKHYYFQGNESVKEDINQLFEFQRLNWS